MFSILRVSRIYPLVSVIERIQELLTSFTSEKDVKCSSELICYKIPVNSLEHSHDGVISSKAAGKLSLHSWECWEHFEKFSIGQSNCPQESTGKDAEELAESTSESEGMLLD